MPWAVFAISLILSVVAEVVAGNYGWLAPCVPILAFYFTMRFGAQRALLGAVMAAAMVDACWMHHFPSQILTVLLVTGLSSAWKPYGDVNSGLSLVVSGICIGIVSWGIHLLGLMTSVSFSLSFVYIVNLLIIQIVISIIITPVSALLLNRMLRRSVTWLSIIDEGND
ncbi:MAG: hypothetical protein IKR13_00130 [Victivallales bacterium]|nr:hypothetical protein [Victivallales bacterium]